jgi:hypothetical protein
VQEPLLVLVEGEGRSLEEIEAGFLAEAVEFTDRWISVLPASSRWSPFVATLARTAGRSLTRRAGSLAQLR